MKPSPTSSNNPAPILAFGAHPDDIEFGAGALIALETKAGRTAHFVVCSRGEAASNGAPDQRAAEAHAAAKILDATLHFADLGGDARFAPTPQNAITLARFIREIKPAILLAPTPVENQHPDHAALAKIVRDAARLARYAGLSDLQPLPAHAIDHLLFYAITPDAEPRDQFPLLIDVSDPAILAIWTRSMEAHASQMKTRNYLDLQLIRARLNGLRAGVSHALALFPNDPLVLSSLSTFLPGARHF